MWSWLTPLLVALIPSLIDGFLGRRLDPEEQARIDQLNKNTGALEAGNATLSTIGAIASERADLPADADDVAALARSLRERAERDRAAAGRGLNGSGVRNPREG